MATTAQPITARPGLAVWRAARLRVALLRALATVAVPARKANVPRSRVAIVAESMGAGSAMSRRTTAPR